MLIQGIAERRSVSAASTNINTHGDWFRHVAVIDGAA